MDRKRLKAQWNWLLLAVILLQVQYISCKTVVKVTVTAFSNPTSSRDVVRTCCGGSRVANTNQCPILNPSCRMNFVVCAGNKCGVKLETGLNEFKDQSFLRMLRLESFTGLLNLSITATDRTFPVDTFSYSNSSLAAEPSSALPAVSEHVLTLDGQRTIGTPTTIVVTLSVYCAQDFYGPTCDKTCVPSIDCKNGFFSCSQTGQKQCKAGFGPPGVCTQQDNSSACALPDNPNPPVSRVGYFKGTYNCGGKTLTMYIFSEGSSGSDLQYISYEDTNGKLVRVKMALGDTATQKESLTVNQPTIPLGGTITSLPGATKFRYQFTSPAACVLEFAIEPTAGTDRCHHGGTCIQMNGVSLCCCNQYATGVYCEKQLDPCDANPCGAGTCAPNTNNTDFICSCPTGYFGKTCQMFGADIGCQPGICNSLPCVATPQPPSGECNCPAPALDACVVPTSLPLVCPPGTFGPACAPCSPMDNCTAHYTCDVTNGTVMCLPGWIGDNCDQRIFPPQSDPACPEQPCENGGVCWNGTCCCPDDSAGDFCQKQSTESPSTISLSTEASSSVDPTTRVQTSESPTSEAPTSERPTSEAPTSKSPTSEAPTSKSPTSEAPTSESPTSEAPTTVAPSTEGQTTVEQTTTCLPGTSCEGARETTVPTSASPTTEQPSTETPTTEPQTSQPPTTEPPTTGPPTTEPPTTEPPTTEPATTVVTTMNPTTEQTTAPPTSEAPTSEPPTSEAPTSQPPTSQPPTSQPPTSQPPTSQPPTSQPPTSQPPTSQPPTSQPPTSQPPTSQPPTSQPPTSQPPTSQPPTSQPPTSQPPTSQPPTSQPPTSQPPTSQPPTSQPPTSQPPTSQPPTSQPPTSQPPTSQPPTSQPPTSQPPTSQPPTSQPPTSQPPTSQPPTSQPPTSQPPTSQPPTSQPPTSEPPTSQPPTSEPPTSEPPTSKPPTSEPPTSEPPTSQPPTSEPPTSEPPTSEPPTSEPPTSEPPTSEPPTSEPPTAGVTTPEASSSIAPSTEQTTVAQTTSCSPGNCGPTSGAPTSEAPTSVAPTTEPPTTEPPTTEPPTTEPPTTEPPTTEPPTTEPPTTEPPTTEPPTTEPPTTEPPTTEPPTTEPPTTEPPTTEPPTTEPPTTEPPTTEPPTTEPPTTEPPTTEPPTTEPPTTEPPTTEPPTTEPPTTEPPTTEPPTTEPPTTEPPTTEPPTTEPPTTEPPTTEPPTTEPPTTEPPTTEPPTTEPPTTEPPTTEPPTTEPPTTEPPTTEPPTTEPPTTEPPTTEPPTTEPPTTEPPTTEPPTTEPPTTEPPTTEPPTTEPPTTLAASSEGTTAAPISETTTPDQLTLEQLLALLLQLIQNQGGDTAAKQDVVNSQAAALTAASKVSPYLPCPFTSFRQDATTNALTFVGMDCSGIGLEKDMEATITIRPVLLNGEWVTRLQFSAPDSRLQQLLKQGVNNALTDNDVTILDATAVKNEFDFSLHYEFIVVGEHVDEGWVGNVTVGIKNTFAAKFTAEINLEVWIPRAQETIGEDQLAVTKLFYWVGRNGQRDNLLDPATSAAPSNGEIVASLKTLGIEVTTYTGVTFDYDLSFGVFINGKVYETDVVKFEGVLQSWWRMDSGKTQYAKSKVKVKMLETFYSSVKGSWVETTKLVYFVQLEDDSFVSGSWFDVTHPTTDQVAAAITFEAAAGGAYTVVQSISRSMNMTTHSTASSESWIRAKETFGVYFEGRVPEDQTLTTKLEASMSALFTSVAEEKGTITITVLNSEELVTATGSISTRVNLAVFANNTMVDARRIQSKSPSLETVAATVVGVSRPNGESYTLVTNITEVTESVVMEQCFTQTIVGAVTKQELSKFETSITKATLETNTALSSSTTSVKVLTSREMVAADGSTMSSLIYKIEVTSGGITNMVDASVALQTRVSTETITSKIDFKRVDGSDFEVFGGNATSILRYDDMVSLYVETTVVKTDYVKFEEKLTNIVKEKYSTAANMEVKVNVIKQDRFRKETGEVSIRLGYFVMVDGKAVNPAGVATIEPSRIQSDVKVVNPGGVAYKVKVESSEIASLTREESLFSSVFTALVAESDRATLQVSLVAAWKEERAETIGASVVTCKIVSVDEYVTEKSESTYKMIYTMSVANQTYSALEEQTVATATVAKQVSTVKNPQGVAYSLSTAATSSLVDLSFSSSVVLSSAFSQSQTINMSMAILKATSTKLTASVQQAVSVNVIRQRETLDVTTGKMAYAVDFQLSFNGQVTSSAVLPAMETKTLVSEFSQLTGVTISVLDVDVTKVHTLESSFALTLSAEVKTADYAKFQTILTQSYQENGAFTKSTISVTVAGTEETIDVKSGGTYYNLRYIVMSDSKMLDARVDTQLSTSVLTTKINAAKLTDVNGAAYTVVDITSSSSTKVVRKARTTSLTVKGQFATGDMTSLSTSVKTVIEKKKIVMTVTVKRQRRETSSVTVTAVQQRERFNALGGSFTEVLMEIKAGDSQVNPAILDPIPAKEVLTEMSTKKLVTAGGYTAVEKTVSTSLLDAKDSFSFLLSASVSSKDITTLQTKIETTLKQSAEFSTKKDLKVTIVRQAEMLSVSGGSSWSAHYFVSEVLAGSQTVISSRVVKKMSTAELQQSLTFSMSSKTGSTYKDVLVADQGATGLIKLADLHTMTTEQQVSTTSFTAIETTLTAVVATVSGLKAPQLKVIKQERFINVHGQINYKTLYSVKSESKIIRSIDVFAASSTAISSSLSTASIKSAKGKSLVVIDKKTAVKMVRERDCFSMVLDTKVAMLDKTMVETSIAQAYAEENVGVDVTAVTVKIRRQAELVNNIGQSFSKVLFTLGVNNTGQSSQIQGQISTTALKKALAGKIISGSQKTFAKAVTDVTKIETRDYDTLASVVTSIKLKTSEIAALETEMAASIKASSTSLSSKSVSVKILKQETIVSVTGEKLTKMSAVVKADGKVIDYKQIPDYNEDTLKAKVAASVSLQAAGLTVKTGASLATSMRVSDAVVITVKNKVLEADTKNIILVLQNAYKKYDQSLASAVLTLVDIKEYKGIKGTTLSALRFFVKVGSSVVKQSLSLSALTEALAQVTTVRQEKLSIKEESDVKTFLPYSSCFKIHFTRKVYKADYVSIQNALAQSWKDFRKDYLAGKIEELTGEWNVKIIAQEEAFGTKGSLVIRVVYVVKSITSVLDAEITDAVPGASIEQHLAAITISGQGTTKYSSVLFKGDLTTVARKRDLCMVAMDQLVSPTVHAEMSSTLVSVWKELYTQYKTLSISILGQQEFVWNQRGAVFGVYYRAVSPDAEISCPDFQPEFLSKLKEKLTVKTVLGHVYTVSKALGTEIMEKSMSFSLLLSQTVHLEDAEALQAAMTTAWSSAKSVTNATVQISIQDEMLSLQGKIVWRVHYFVMVAGVHIDASIEKGLTAAQIEAALKTVKIRTSSATYDTLLTSDVAAALFEYRTAFFINMATEIRSVDLLKFTDAISLAWKQSEASFSGKTINVNIISNEEIVDALGTFAIRLVYYVTLDNKLQDSRIVATLSEKSIKDNIVAKITGANGAYKIITSLSVPVRRLIRGRVLYVVAAVPNADNVKFEKALVSVYGATLKNVGVKIAYREQYIKKSKLVTALTYFVSISGVEVLPSTLPLMTSEIKQKIAVSRGANENYKIVEDVAELFRYRYLFSVYLSRPVQTSHLDSVLQRLLGEWKKVQTSMAADLKINMGLQEEAATATKQIVWKLSYFLSQKTTVLLSSQNVPLAAIAVTRALAVTTTGSETYADYVIADANGIVRLTDLLSVALNERAAASKFTEFQTALTAAWKVKYSSYSSVVVTIVTQDKYVSNQGEMVWLLYYKAELGSHLLSGLDFSISTDILKETLKVKSPRGVPYSLYTLSIASVRRYKSAFSFFISRNVQSVDQLVIVSKLKSAWTSSRTDLEKVLVENAFLEEHNTKTGISVYKFSYYVTGQGVLVDSLFEKALTVAKTETALDVTLTGMTQKYKEFLYKKDTRTLIAFSSLVSVPFSTPISSSNYLKISNEIQAAWHAIDSSYANLTVTIRGHEEYLDKEGNFVFNLLYVIKRGDQVVLLEDLSDLSVKSLAAIEKITNPFGVAYKLSTVPAGELRRYKMSMHLFLDQWVSYTDLESVLGILQNVIKDTRPEYFSLRIERATQEWHIKDRSKIVRFVFFGYMGTRLLDGTREEPLIQSKVVARFTAASLKYSVLSTVSLDGARNLRSAYRVYVAGKVATADVVGFQLGLASVWKTLNSKSSVEIVLSKEEYINTEQDIVSGVTYFVAAEGALVSSYLVPGPSASELDKSLVITAQSGATYKLYHGEATAYLNHYSLLLNGEVNMADTTSLVTALRDVWVKEADTDRITIEVSKMEQNLAKYGGTVTKMLYAVKVNGHMTFPADRPTPDAKLTKDAVTKAGVILASLYSGFPPVRADQCYTVVIADELKKGNKSELQTAIKNVWNAGPAASLRNPTYVLRGRQSMAATSPVMMLSEVYYQVFVDGKLVAIEDLKPPSTTQLVTELRTTASLEVYSAPALRVRSMTFSGAIATSQRSTVQSAIQKAWMANNIGQAIAVTVVKEEPYSTPTWAQTTKVGFTLSVGGIEAGTQSVSPSIKQINNKLSEYKLSLCGCSATRRRVVYMEGSGNVISQKSQQIQTGVKRAWTKVNQEIPTSKVEVEVKVVILRKRRETNRSATYLTDDGKEVTPVAYTVLVDGQDPDELFVATPNDTTLNDELRNVSGHGTCGCVPRKCYNILLKGPTSEAEKSILVKSITEAYLEANPTVTASNITVDIYRIANDKKDKSTGIVVSEVTFCVSTGDDDRNLKMPTDGQLNDALKRVGKSLYDGDLSNLGNKSDQWILIIVVVCGAVALILVSLAFVKVCCRHMRRYKEATRADAARSYEDEEVYAGHGMYNSTFGKSEYASSVYCGNNQLFETKSYIMAPGSVNRNSQGGYL